MEREADPSPAMLRHLMAPLVLGGEAVRLISASSNHSVVIQHSDEKLGLGTFEVSTRRFQVTERSPVEPSCNVHTFERRPCG